MNFRFSMFLFALVAMTFFSCDNEDIVEANTTKMIGDWIPTSVTATGCTDSSDNGTLSFDNNGEICVTEFLIEICVTAMYTYRADGTYSSSFVTTTAGLETSNDTDSGTWTILDATRMEICSNNPTDPNEPCTVGTYTIVGNTLTFSGEDPSSGCNLSIVANKQ